METVGIRELKNHLSRHMERVCSGTRLLVTHRGRSIATISPVEAPSDTAWANALVETGQAHWNGSKPVGARRPASIVGRSVSALVLEERQ
jgi:prevent-host-death family protein